MKVKYIALLVLPFFIGCEGDENSVTHNQGISCNNCHSFNASGTIFSKLTAGNNDSSNVNDNYTIKLLSDTGTAITFGSGRGRGNKLTSSSIPSKFTAQVIDSNGKVVNSSMTNSHYVSRGNCNTCHSATGSSGAPGRVVGYDYYNNLKAKIK